MVMMMTTIFCDRASPPQSTGQSFIAEMSPLTFTDFHVGDFTGQCSYKFKMLLVGI